MVGYDLLLESGAYLLGSDICEDYPLFEVRKVWDCVRTWNLSQTIITQAIGRVQRQSYPFMEEKTYQ